jgi:protein-L-isoaspartate(D-aspartate) O-methyltransferase
MTPFLPPSPDRQAEAARAAMIESQLMPCGVVAPALVAAFAAVPREPFVDPARRTLAYVDAAQPLGRLGTGAEGRFLMPPLSLGYLLQALGPRPGERALVVGAGTGYAAAILVELGLAVTAVEEAPALAEVARARLGERATVVKGPLTAGWPDGAPYDLLLIDGGVEMIPEALWAQLKDGGRLAAVVRGTDGVDRPSLGRRVGTHFHLEPFAESGAPLLPGFARARPFVFA